MAPGPDPACPSTPVLMPVMRGRREGSREPSTSVSWVIEVVRAGSLMWVRSQVPRHDATPDRSQPADAIQGRHIHPCSNVGADPRSVTGVVASVGSKSARYSGAHPAFLLGNPAHFLRFVSYLATSHALLRVWLPGGAWVIPTIGSTDVFSINSCKIDAARQSSRSMFA